MMMMVKMLKVVVRVVKAVEQCVQVDSIEDAALFIRIKHVLARRTLKNS